ncbi:hypothetical protein NIA69_22080 [Gemmiger formicilis]|nr:hypothetical protein [Gemmiger formicilis]
METITSRENAKIKYACAVRDSEKQRAADGLFFAEGPKLCLELAKAARRVRCTPRRRRWPKRPSWPNSTPPRSRPMWPKN